MVLAPGLRILHAIVVHVDDLCQLDSSLLDHRQLQGRYGEAILRLHCSQQRLEGLDYRCVHLWNDGVRLIEVQQADVVAAQAEVTS